MEYGEYKQRLKYTEKKIGYYSGKIKRLEKKLKDGPKEPLEGIRLEWYNKKLQEQISLERHYLQFFEKDLEGLKEAYRNGEIE